MSLLPPYGTTAPVRWPTRLLAGQRLAFWDARRGHYRLPLRGDWVTPELAVTTDRRQVAALMTERDLVVWDRRGTPQLSPFRQTQLAQLRWLDMVALDGTFGDNKYISWTVPTQLLSPDRQRAELIEQLQQDADFRTLPVVLQMDIIRLGMFYLSLPMGTEGLGIIIQLQRQTKPFAETLHPHQDGGRADDGDQWRLLSTYLGEPTYFYQRGDVLQDTSQTDRYDPRNWTYPGRLRAYGTALVPRRGAVSLHRMGALGRWHSEALYSNYPRLLLKIDTRPDR